MTVHRGDPRLPRIAVALGAALALAALWLVFRESPSERARGEARHLRELFLELGRQRLLDGDAERSLVYLSEAYHDAAADDVSRFLAARAVEALSEKAPVPGGLRNTVRPLRVSLARAAHEPGEAWSSADLNADWTRLVAVGAGGEAAVFDPLDGRRLVDLAAAPGGPSRVRFSPDGVHVAGVHGGGRFSLWHGDTGELVFTSEPPRRRTGSRHAAGAATAFSGDGRRLATATADRAVSVWDTADGSLLASIDAAAGTLAFSPDGRRLVTAGDRVAMIWNAATGKPVVSLDLPRSAVVHDVAYSPDGRHVAAVGRPPEVRLFDAGDGELVAFLEGSGGTVRRVAFSPSGQLVLTAGDDGTARIWDAARGRLLHVLPLPSREAIHAEYGPRSARIATLSADGTLDVRPVPLDDAGPAEIDRLRRCFVPWRLLSARLVPATPDPRDCDEIRPTSGDFRRSPRESPPAGPAVTPIAASKPGPLPSGLRAVVTGEVVDAAGAPVPGAEVRIWREDAALRTLRHGGAVHSAAFSPDGERVVTAGRDGAARVWEAATGRLLDELRHADAVNTAAFSPDGRRVLTAADDGMARIWGVPAASGPPLRLRGHKGAVRCAAYSPDGRRVATAADDGTARLWDAATGRPLGAPLTHRGAVSSLGFSMDGRRLVTVSEGRARVWDVERGRVVTRPLRHAGLTFAAFSPNGLLLATAGLGGVRFWWVTPDEWGKTFGSWNGAPVGHRGLVSSVAFSLDSRWLATSGWNGKAWVRPAAEPAHTATRPDAEHGAPINHVAFSPDSRFLVTASEDDTARIWRAPGTSDAGSMLALVPPLATADAAGRVRFEVGRFARHKLLVSQAGYRAPDVLLLSAGGESREFLAELSAGAAPSRLRELKTKGSAPPATYVLLKGADLVETLRTFAVLLDLDLLLAPDVRGTVHAELPGLAPVQAFEEILRGYDLSHETSRSLGFVLPRHGRPLAPASEALSAYPLSARPDPDPGGFSIADFLDLPPRPERAGPPAGAAPVRYRDVAELEAPEMDPLEAEVRHRKRFPEGEPIHMSLKNADLVETFVSFSSIGGFDLAVDPEVSGTLSVELRDVPWQRALNAILRLHDLRLEVSGNTWRIRRREPGP